MESGGLRFDSSWELRIFSLSYARDKTKNIFLNFFTELKTYFLSYSFYKGLIIPLLFSVLSILILVCNLHPTALSVHRIHRKRCTRMKKTTRTKPFKCYLCSLLLKNSLLQKSNSKTKKKSMFGSFSAAKMLIRIFAVVPWYILPLSLLYVVK